MPGYWFRWRAQRCSVTIFVYPDSILLITMTKAKARTSWCLTPAPKTSPRAPAPPRTRSKTLALQRLNLLFCQCRHPPPDKVNLPKTHVQRPRHLHRRQLPHQMQIENQIMFLLHLGLEALHRHRKHIGLPLLVPDLFQVRRRRRGLLLPMGIDRLGRTSLSQLIGNAPANDVAQPAPETSRPPVTLELLNAVGHGNDRLLNNLLRLRLAQARPERNRVDEPPVTIEEILPPRLVSPVLQPAQQSVAG